MYSGSFFMPARRTGRWQRALRTSHDLLPPFLILQLHKFKNTEERKCIAANTIARIETGNRGISIDLAIELVVRFDTTLDYIFLGRE